MPDHEYRDDAERPICDTRDRRVPISGIDRDLWVDACPLPTSVLRPEIGGRPTLQDEQEEVKGAIDLNHCYNGPDNDPVRSCDRNSKKENTNTEFEGHVREDIDGLACPPPLNDILVEGNVYMLTSYLQTNRNLCWGKGIGVLPGAVEDTGNGETAEENEEYLPSSISNKLTGTRGAEQHTHATTANQSSIPKLFTTIARQ
jgi:hypothetical protein